MMPATMSEQTEPSARAPHDPLEHLMFALAAERLNTRRRRSDACASRQGGAALVAGGAWGQVMAAREVIPARELWGYPRQGAPSCS